MMEYLIRFVQIHETFRQPEVEALAELKNIKFRWIDYADNVGPFFLSLHRYMHGVSPQKRR